MKITTPHRIGTLLAAGTGAVHSGTMFNLLSIAVGCVALLLALPAMVPFLGLVNWLVIPIALVGIFIGLLSPYRSGRNFNLVILIVSIVRLMLGHGIF